MVRLAGRHFMLSIAFLFFFIGIQALVYSRIEHWSYFDGIYYSIVTMLTIGFGDFSPETVAGKILVLPFAVVTISQLANEVSIIVQYFSGKQNERRAIWRRRYETTFRQEAEKRNPEATLAEEIRLIDEIARREELITQLWDLIWSLSSLTIFWYSRRAVDSELCHSHTPETVTGLLSTYSNHHVTLRERERTNMTESAAFTAHRDFVAQHRKSFDSMLESRRSRFDRGARQSGDGNTETETISQATFDEQAALVEAVLNHALRLEAIARHLLIDTLPRDSIARTILLADREVQLRDVAAAGGDVKKIIDLAMESDRLIEEENEDPVNSPSASTNDNLDAIRRYRETFAGLVTSGARLQKLEGEERLIFERRRPISKTYTTTSSRNVEEGSRMSSMQRMESRQGLTSAEKFKQKKNLFRAIFQGEKEIPHLP
ncbi:hypothetical protein QFC21_001391 [Naganishia friedmannii]|uniref:Uncharacterized protein n=1 Tax=Naganishia friedmannii TaxID=89922 RepID=A0ACC2W5B3_9TREE|nr:hypothetical protein QFC21_001391 [Naganishia friedmannii]